MTERRQIFAFSGMLAGPGDGHTNADLTTHALSLSGAGDGQRVCYLPTALGDSPLAVAGKQAEFSDAHPETDFSVLTLFTQPSVDDVRSHLMAQDVILVEGGSIVNLMAVWQAHGIPTILRECWESAVVLAGASAGSLCWHTGGATDSFGDSLAPFTDGLALLPWSNGVHDDVQDQPRRSAYRELVARRVLGPGYATEDGVGLHYVGTELSEAVSLRPSASAWYVQPDEQRGWRETRVTPRHL